MINRPVMMVSINRNILSPGNVEDVSVYNSIDMTLPEMVFKIMDLDGSLLSGLDIYIGATVNINMVEVDDSENAADKNYEITDFVITKIFDGFEAGNAGMGGFLQIWCRPAWYLFGRYQGHAYPPMKLSELIKQVCSEANDNVKLVIEDDRFASSSDPGDTPRYKCGESDLEFIEKKLLPYTNINDSTVLFYLDWFNRPNLTSFERLIGQEPKVLIGPPLYLSETVGDKIQDLAKEKGITEFFMWTDINLTVGNEDVKKAFATLKKRIELENNATGKVYVADQQPRAKIGRNTRSSFFAKMPVNALTMEYIEATSIDAYPNKPLHDALALSRNSDHDVVDLMEIELTVNGAVDNFVAGDTVYLLTPLRDIDVDEANKNKEEDEKLPEELGKKNVHWLNGKWLLKSIMMNQIKCNPIDFSTVLTLVRPTLEYELENTTINNPKYFYSVD